jgi:hypothetical protein
VAAAGAPAPAFDASKVFKADEQPVLKYIQRAWNKIDGSDAVAVKEMLQDAANKAAIDTPDENGNNMLSLAASVAKPGIVKVLLEAQADPNAKLGEEWSERDVSALYRAVEGGSLEAVEALVEAGAKIVVLSSRSGDVPSASQAKVDALRDMGCEILVEKCDTGKEKDVQGLLDRIRANCGLITAVVHAAGLVADKPVLSQDDASLQKVFEPKAVGGWLLHKYTQVDSLNAFVLFSSVVALRGSKNQSNYAAANGYLDDLAKLRAAQGLPAVSVQWPAVDLSGRMKPAEDGLDVSVSPGTVKQVVKQLFSGLEKISPVQAVLPGAYLVPSSPMVTSQLEPLGVREPDYVAPNKIREMKNFSLVV